MKKLLPLIAFLLVAKISTAQTPPNTTITTSGFYSGEPYLAINPKNPKNIIIGYMMPNVAPPFNKVGIGTQCSFDGGLSWGNFHQKDHAYSTWGSADVCIRFRNNGTAYLTFIDYRQNPDSGGVYICNSTNGGINWTTPTKVFDALADDPGELPIDRPWLAVDNTNSNKQGTFYVTTMPPTWEPKPNRPYVKVSADSGQTWSNYRYVDTTAHLVGTTIAQPIPNPCVAADGALCISYPSHMTSQSVFPKLYLAKSYNKGGTFAYTDILSNPPLVTSSPDYKQGANLAANSLNANQLAMAYLGEQNANDPDVFVTTTNNGGTTWGPLVKVNDDASGKAQDMVWCNYSNNNKLVVVWRDRRNGSGPGIAQASDIYCSVSGNNGANFSTNIKLSNVTVPYDTILDNPGNDFLCCELFNDTIYATWSDVRNPTNKLNIYFTKTSIVTGMGTGPVLVNESALTLFPNPSGGVVNLKFNSGGLTKSKVSVYDASGRLILVKEMAGDGQIDLKGQKDGTYFVNVESEGRRIHSEKIIITE